MYLLLLLLSFLPIKRHDYHVSHTNMVVEEKTIALSIRIFRDDFEEALRIYRRNPSFTLDISEESDAAVMAYFHQYLKVKVNNRQLRATLASSSEKGDMWMFVLSYQSRRPIQSVEVYHSVLMRLFADQRNIFKLLFLPENSEHYFYYVKDAERKTFRRN